MPILSFHHSQNYARGSCVLAAWNPIKLETEFTSSTSSLTRNLRRVRTRQSVTMLLHKNCSGSDDVSSFRWLQNNQSNRWKVRSERSLLRKKHLKPAGPGRWRASRCWVAPPSGSVRKTRKNKQTPPGNRWRQYQRSTPSPLKAMNPLCKARRHLRVEWKLRGRFLKN